MRKCLKTLLIMLFIFSVVSYQPPENKAVLASESNKRVILGGEAFGIRMFSDGVLVIEVEESLFGFDTESPAKSAGLKPNDIIKKVNNQPLYSNEQLTDTIENSQGKEIKLTFERDGIENITTLIPKSDNQGNYRAGMWVKDSAAGIGTITYFDAETMSFGALGHGICESETGTLLPISYGDIASATISDITKSENGSVGALNGYFDGNSIGEATLNTELGIFGNYYNEIQSESIEIADKREVKTGYAQIYCTVEGSKRAYNIKIKRLRNTCENNGMVIEITDPKLLELTGGIVQGMSGSPIVQNGKLVGAVTHVLINNVVCGYGVFIEDMMNAI